MGDLTPSLTRMREAEENNFQTSLERLGDTASLVEDLLAGYEALFRLLRETEDPPEHLFSVSLLFLSCAYQFEKACLECLRGRLTDSVQITRRAIEAAAFSVRIARHPHLAEVWLKASIEDGTYETYRKKFTACKLFPAGDPVLERMGRRWDSSSRQSHTSAYSLSRRSSIRLEDDKLEFEFAQFEVEDADHSEPARALLWIMDTHFGVLQLFEGVLTQQLGPSGLSAWQVRKNALDAKFSEHKERWRPLIQTLDGDEDTAGPGDLDVSKMADD